MIPRLDVSPKRARPRIPFPPIPSQTPESRDSESDASQQQNGLEGEHTEEAQSVACEHIASEEGVGQIHGEQGTQREFRAITSRPPGPRLPQEGTFLLRPLQGRWGIPISALAQRPPGIQVLALRTDDEWLHWNPHPLPPTAARGCTTAHRHARPRQWQVILPRHHAWVKSPPRRFPTTGDGFECCSVVWGGMDYGLPQARLPIHWKDQSLQPTNEAPTRSLVPVAAFSLLLVLIGCGKSESPPREEGRRLVDTAPPLKSRHYRLPCSFAPGRRPLTILSKTFTSRRIASVSR